MNYKSSIVTLNLFIQDFPGSKYKEDALFYKFDSQYNIAINSIESKMKERLMEALEIYDQLFQYYPNTKYKAKADTTKEKITKILNPA
jgi:outer membrane protein assembly factor BamD